MTKQELLDNGYKPQQCKIGTLYFKDGFFCRLNYDEVVYYSNSDDMHPLGLAKTFDEIKELEKKHYKSVMERIETKLKLAKLDYKERYGEEV